MVTTYTHEPFTDFSDAKNQEEFEAALQYVKSELGKDYPLIIGGEKVDTDEKTTSVNPANPEQVIGRIAKARQKHADQAMTSALEAFQTWKKWDPEARANVLYRAAHLVKRRKHEFSAWMVYEIGKTRKEADADTAEAIDFLEYYARQMVELKPGIPINSRSFEHNQFFYIPLGPGLTVSPWNLPFAIMAGTTVGPMVAGNTVMLKPATNTPVIAYKFMEVLIEAGMPDGVVNYIPGSGSEIGDYLVDHPETHWINFTGSKEIGTRIYERSAKVQPGQTHLKRAIIEMGGKDGIVVDSEADLDLAAESILYSAYGFAGQKCSACSRAIVHQDVYETVLEKVKALAENAVVGNPEHAETYMGPVKDEEAFNSILEYIEIGKGEAELVTGGTGDKTNGYFIQPTIFKDADPESRIMQEEIFGPVVAFTKAEDFTHAIEIANNTIYGLTGAVISNNRAHLEQAREDFHVGNLYFNRGCTAAIVGYQPFGGFNMSGTDAKAGGPDYLLHFMQPKTVSDHF
ncbi:delta-1-pyrroline-5-carboxylate dehydrogenase [Salsuginibacillus halophilus]|uniref:L-glutamate gamma-semialdehyde dehydrogenase n=1 Tax=Salsuginibacillus halophilus TaxID=517424 RepID=A0A2P8HFT1_9BACI|nr:L-glutamate gamma-semialdehyde dehydrogenase [Salsuginibacillus halophilus]PSL45089.1 delta-1-pyrroline-5-carboxylate dehydrogenase [Salsuginibacillus halophilus]